MPKNTSLYVPMTPLRLASAVLGGRVDFWKNGGWYVLRGFGSFAAGVDLYSSVYYRHSLEAKQGAATFHYRFDRRQWLKRNGT